MESPASAATAGPATGKPASEGGKNNSHIAFLADFTHGSFINTLINCLKITNSEGAFRFTPAGITYAQCNGNEAILNQFVIYGEKLGAGRFVYNSRSRELIFGVSLAELKPQVACLTKDSLRFYIEIDNSNEGFTMLGNDLEVESLSEFMTIQKYERNQGSSPGAFKTIRRMILSEDAQQKLRSDVYYDDTRSPNCEIPIKVFNDMCSEITSSKANSIKITAYPNGLEFFSTKDGDIASGYYPFGIIPTIVKERPKMKINLAAAFAAMGISPGDPIVIETPTKSGPVNQLIIQNPTIEDVLILQVELSAIKMMKKFNNVSHKDTRVKIFVNLAEKYLEFAIPIGPDPGIGHLMVLLRDVKTQNDKLTTRKTA